MVGGLMHVWFLPPNPHHLQAAKDINKPCPQLLAHGPSPFPFHLRSSWCYPCGPPLPCRVEADASQPRPTFCSDQQDTRIPTAHLSLSPAGTSELQQSLPMHLACSGVRGSRCGRTVPVLITQGPTQPCPPARLPSEHHLSALWPACLKYSAVDALQSLPRLSCRQSYRARIGVAFSHMRNLKPREVVEKSQVLIACWWQRWTLEVKDTGRVLSGEHPVPLDAGTRHFERQLLLLFFFFWSFFLLLLGPLPQHMEVPMLGVESEL